jgi:nucleoside-diphosphate-sugar epimerase
MRVLLTGVSSFTGCWFAEALAASGAEVVATCRRPLADYAALPRQRLDKALAAGCRIVEGVAFGDQAFLGVMRSQGPFELLCHHGAEVGDLRRPDYDPLAALASATRSAAEVMRLLADAGGRGLVVTGSVFQADEGGGDGGPVNAYGLAKTLAWQTLRFHASRCGLGLGHLIIPHPFGPLEKPGFTSSLVQAWLAGRPAVVRRPDLVRDFVHVDMLAAAYAGLCSEVCRHGGTRRSAPSGHVGTLLELARLLARELGPRLDRPCEVTAQPDTSPIDEPTVRINAGPGAALATHWPVARSWDRYASFHKFGGAGSIYG